MSKKILPPLAAILVLLVLFFTAYVPMKRFLTDLGLPLYGSVAVLLSAFSVVLAFSALWAWRAVKK